MKFVKQKTIVVIASILNSIGIRNAMQELNVIPGTSYWKKYTDEYYEHDKRTNTWFPRGYYVCALCGAESLNAKNECPNCKSHMQNAEVK